MIIVLTGVSGVGKTTLANYLSDKFFFKKSISYTTRSKRKAESSNDYNFISKEDFEAKINLGFFLEWIYQFDNYYGTGIDAVQKLIDAKENIVMCLEKNGYLKAKNYWPDLFGIYLMPPDEKTLIQRISLRNDGQLQTRLENIYEQVEKDSVFFENKIKSVNLNESFKALEKLIFDKL